MARRLTPAAALRRLQAIQDRFGEDLGSEKNRLLEFLDRRRLPRARDVHGLHEVLCFLRAYPDDARTLARVEEMLSRFSERGDLRRHRSELVDTGIAGTRIYYSFFWFTARWLARRWPDRLRIDWAEFARKNDLERFYSLLLPYTEGLTLDDWEGSSREWLELFKGPEETDAEFLIRRFAALRGSPFEQETFFESLDVPFRLDPAPGTPSRTRARYPKAPVVFQTRPLERSRPDLRQELRRPPVRVQTVSPRDGQVLIDMAREAMITRARDLDNFAHADRNDVRMIECGDGLQFACFGLVPERRLMLESVYGMLTLKNGVPIGYVLASALFESSEIMYNVFETYRGGEAGRVYGRVMAMVRDLFAPNAFTVDPYQLGHNNREGQESGAWWFYYKLGYRPYDPGVRRLLRDELAKMKKNSRHRSSLATLQGLSAAHVFFFLDRPRTDVLGRLDLGSIGRSVSRYLADRFGADRERGLRVCADEAGELLGVRSWRRLPPGPRLAWERWGPLVMAMPEVQRWSAANRRALARVIRAKGGRRETDFVAAFDAHRPLRRAVLCLARRAG